MSGYGEPFGAEVISEVPPEPARPFDGDGFIGDDPRLASQRFEYFSTFSAELDDSNRDADNGLPSPVVPLTQMPQPIYGSGDGYTMDPLGFSTLSQETNGKVDSPYNGVFAETDGPVLSPPSEMLAEEGFALREWKRLNSIQLEEGQKREKELLEQIIDEADEYKVDFYNKTKINCETNKANNREKEKLFLATREKFHAEANKQYWKAIAELIPNEVVAIEKRRGKKDQQQKPSIVVIQGPKPGKPTDLSRMREILSKLKYSPPPHLKPPTPPAAAATAPVQPLKEGKIAAADAPKPSAVVITLEAVAAA